MKKLSLIIVAVAITSGAYAQSDSTKIKMSTQNMHNNQDQNMKNYSVDKSHPDGIVMKDGKIMMLKNGKMTSLDQDITLSNGTKVMKDGTYIKKDGTKTMLKEGQHLDMSGKVTSPKTEKGKDIYLVPDSIQKKH